MKSSFYLFLLFFMFFSQNVNADGFGNLLQAIGDSVKKIEEQNHNNSGIVADKASVIKEPAVNPDLNKEIKLLYTQLGIKSLNTAMQDIYTALIPDDHHPDGTPFTMTNEGTVFQFGNSGSIFGLTKPGYPECRLYSYLTGDTIPSWELLTDDAKIFMGCSDIDNKEISVIPYSFSKDISLAGLSLGSKVLDDVLLKDNRLNTDIECRSGFHLHTSTFYPGTSSRGEKHTLSANAFKWSEKYTCFNKKQKFYFDLIEEMRGNAGFTIVKIQMDMCNSYTKNGKDNNTYKSIMEKLKNNGAKIIENQGGIENWKNGDTYNNQRALQQLITYVDKAGVKSKIKLNFVIGGKLSRSYPKYNPSCEVATHLTWTFDLNKSSLKGYVNNSELIHKKAKLYTDMKEVKL